MRSYISAVLIAVLVGAFGLARAAADEIDDTLGLEAGMEAGAAALNEIIAETSDVKVGVGTSTAITPVNHKTGGGSASGSTAYGAYSGNGTAAANGVEFWRDSSPALVVLRHRFAEGRHLGGVDESYHATAEARSGLARADGSGRGHHRAKHRFHLRDADLEQVPRAGKGRRGDSADAFPVAGWQRRRQVQHSLVLFDDEPAPLADRLW